jgi:hypothetical protein
MPTLYLAAKAATISAGVGELHPSGIPIAYSVRLERGRRLLLSSNAEFDRIDTTVTVQNAAHQEHSNKDTVGRMVFFEGHNDPFWPIGPSCIIEVRVPNHHWEALFRLAATGRVPSHFSVTVPGLTYGTSPDGSEVKWDNVAGQELPITAANYTISVKAPPVDFTDGDTQSDVAIPVTGVQLNAVSSKLDRLHADLSFALRVIIGIGVLCLVLLALRP